MGEQKNGSLKCMVWHNNNSRKCVDPRESKIPFSDWNWKILVCFKRFNYYIKKQLCGNVLPVKIVIFLGGVLKITSATKLSFAVK